MIHISAIALLLTATHAAFAASDESSLHQTDVRSVRGSPDEYAEVALCDSAGVGCEGEDDVTYTDVSLLQMDVRLNDEVQTVPYTANDFVAKDRKQHSPHKSTLNVLEAAASIGHKTSGKDHAAKVQATQSVTAQALAWLLQRHSVKLSTLSREGSVAIWIVLLGAMAICLVIVLGVHSKDSDKKSDQIPLRADGAQAFSGRIPSRTPGTDSRLPTAQSLLQSRSPQPSAVALPSSTAVKSGSPPEASAADAVRELDRLTEDASESLPAICPSLILPHTEARFMIQTDHLLRMTTGSVNILGTSGRKLLHALVCDSPDGRRCLMLASCGCEDDPRTCIFTPQGQLTGGQQALEVFGKAGKFYGWLEFPGGAQAVLAWAGSAGNERKPVMTLDTGVGGEDLSMKASTMDGRLLATAGRSRGNVGTGYGAGRGSGSEDTWKMQVKPGVDAVLITSCMLALLLLKPMPQRERLSASTGGGTAASLRPAPSGSPAAPMASYPTSMRS